MWMGLSQLGTKNLLCGAPCGINLKPPKDAYANNVFIEKVQDPVGSLDGAYVTGPQVLTYFHYARRTSGHGREVDVLRIGTT